jgi:general nucleoside transport system permease protein
VDSSIGLTAWPRELAFSWRRLSARPALRFLGALVIALVAFGLVLLIQGRNPVLVYASMINATLGTPFGRSEVLVKSIPLVLCALAVAVPARVGLVNVGGEGQLYSGALLASGVALFLPSLPAWLLLPLMMFAGVAGGAVWAAVPALLRARGWMNEVISTLLLNYVAILLVQFFVFGPWRDPQSANFPQSRAFGAAAHLPAVGDRVHIGIFFAVGAALALLVVLRRTRWGFEMRAIGGNPQAAARAGIPLGTYVVIGLIVGGALAGLAGATEVSAIQGRLRPTLSPGYGFIGFLVSWLAGHGPLSTIVMALLMALLTASGDALQIAQKLPYASVDLLMALTLCAVLAQRGRPERAT